MVFTKADRILIQELREQKGYGARRLVQEFPNKNWSISAVTRLLQNIKETGSASRRVGSGRPRSVLTDTNMQVVEELVLSQEGKPGTHKSVRHISRQTGIRRGSVHNIIRKALNLKSLKRQRAQALSEASRASRLIRCKQMLRKFSKHMIPFIWFTDEKLFTVAAPINTQNDRLYVPTLTKKREVSAARLLRTRPMFSQSLMVSVAVSAMGSTELFFVEPKAKINGTYYRDVLLSRQLLPAIKQLSGDFFVFQQDSAPAHRARETVALLKRETPDFISPALWPPHSPDLNPVDYKIWSALQQRVYQTPITSVEQLRERLLEEWSRFDQRIIDSAVKQWRQRLEACVQAKGGHFEHQL
jgi:inhibitor of nuclear factor kappa-B kinase subunit alpha